MQEQQSLGPGDLANGDWVNWTRGGLHGQVVPGVVRKVGPKQVQIELRVKPPYSRSPLWESEFKWVAPQGLSRRVYPSEAHGEPLRLEVAGFVLTPWMHPAPSRPICFRGGIFYGAIDGYTCTAPASTAETALIWAHQSLERGYKAQLLSAIQCFQGWFEQGAVAADQVAHVNAQIRDCRARLLKLFEAFPEQIQQGDPSVDDLRALVAGPVDCGVSEFDGQSVAQDVRPAFRAA